MPPLLSALALAPFYLVFSGHSDFSDKTVLPIYAKSIDECNEQAAKVDSIMQGRTTLSVHQLISQTNPHAFCIATGWKPEDTQKEEAGSR